METTIPLPFLVHLDLTKGPPFPNGLPRPQVGYLGCVYFTLGDNEIDKPIRFLQQHGSMKAYVNATKITSLDVIVSILDAGARKVFVSPAQFEHLKSYGDRVALVSPVGDTIHEAPGGVLIECGEDLSAAKSTLKNYVENKATPIFLNTTAHENLLEFVELALEHSAIAIIPTERLTSENAHSKDRLSVPAILAASWTSDRSDHLIPTIVTDERGIALGLVYSSQESVAESLKTGTGISAYWASQYISY